MPSDIASYLTQDEKVLKIGYAEGNRIFLTNKRIIFKTKGFFGVKEIVEASYRHISSIEYEKKLSLGYVIAGIIVIVFGLLINFFPLLDTGISYFYDAFLLFGLNIISVLLSFCGVVLILVGILLSLKPPLYKIYVVGRKPISFYGKNLEELIKIIRQYKEETVTHEKASP